MRSKTKEFQEIRQKLSNRNPQTYTAQEVKFLVDSIHEYERIFKIIDSLLLRCNALFTNILSSRDGHLDSAITGQKVTTQGKQVLADFAKG